MSPGGPAVTVAPSSWTLQRVVATAQAALDRLRNVDGVVLDDETEVLAALGAEDIDVADLLRRLTLAALNAETLAAAQTKRLADLRQRRDRSTKAEALYRGAIADVMALILPADADGVRRFRDAEFTVTLSVPKPKLKITDEAELPAAFVEVTMVREVDKVALKKALDTGRVVPGAVLTNGAPVLTIRTQ